MSHTHVSDLVAEAFRCSHLVFASATYNGEVFTPMDNFLRDLKSHGLRNRTVGLVENGTWAPVSGKQMSELLGTMKDMTVLEGSVSLKSSVKESQRQGLEALADACREAGISLCLEKPGVESAGVRKAIICRNYNYSTCTHF